MSKRTRRTKSPAQIAAELERARERRAQEAAAARAAAKDPTKWGVNVEELQRQGVEVTSSVRGGQAAARRDDVFDRLLARQALSQAAHQAVRRLDADMTERRGDGASDRKLGERMGGTGTRDLVTQRMLDAGKRVDDALALIGRRDAALLRELLEPRQVMVDAGGERWRQVVVVLTGEQRQEVQAGVIRSACENLVLAYRDADNAPRRAA